MATLTRGTTSTVACLGSVSGDYQLPDARDAGGGGAAPRSAIVAGRVDQLRRTIESEIIPRLMLTIREAPPSVGVGDGSRTTDNPADVLKLTELLLTGNRQEVMQLVARASGNGVSRAGILLYLFAPAVVRLGELWEADACDFADVTIAVGTLQQTLRSLSAGGHEQVKWASAQRSILLTPGCGEQHTFPVQMLEFFFQQAGWDVEAWLEFDRFRVCQLLRRRHLGAVGVSISCDSLLDKLESDIDSMRRASRNRSIVILVGGHVFKGRPDLVVRVGADATADDAPSAVRVAEDCVVLEVGADR
jgi:methanogenic corrinoid protein MtbC1